MTALTYYDWKAFEAEARTLPYVMNRHRAERGFFHNDGVFVIYTRYKDEMPRFQSLMTEASFDLLHQFQYGEIHGFIAERTICGERVADVTTIDLMKDVITTVAPQDGNLRLLAGKLP